MKQAPKRKSPKTFLYLVGPLVTLSLLGYVGWNIFGNQLPPPAPEISPSGIEETMEIIVPTESSEAEQISEEIQFTGVLDTAIVDNEGGFFLDPQKISGQKWSTQLTKSLFLTLTVFDVDQAIIVPGAAESWTVSPDGKIYTFKLRPDIPWVQHDLGGETTQVTDENGTPRFLTAADFVYAYQRLCDPRIKDFYLRPTNVQGCQAVLENEN